MTIIEFDLVAARRISEARRLEDQARGLIDRAASADTGRIIGIELVREASVLREKARAIRAAAADPHEEKGDAA